MHPVPISAAQAAGPTARVRLRRGGRRDMRYRLPVLLFSRWVTMPCHHHVHQLRCLAPMPFSPLITSTPPSSKPFPPGDPPLPATTARLVRHGGAVVRGQLRGRPLLVQAQAPSPAATAAACARRARAVATAAGAVRLRRGCGGERHVPQLQRLLLPVRVVRYVGDYPTALVQGVLRGLLKECRTAVCALPARFAPSGCPTHRSPTEMSNSAVPI
jgi:hypothetical protein